MNVAGDYLGDSPSEPGASTDLDVGSDSAEFGGYCGDSIVTVY